MRGCNSSRNESVVCCARKAFGNSTASLVPVQWFADECDNTGGSAEPTAQPQRRKTLRILRPQRVFEAAGETEDAGAQLATAEGRWEGHSVQLVDPSGGLEIIQFQGALGESGSKWRADGRMGQRRKRQMKQRIKRRHAKLKRRFLKAFN